MRRVILVAHEGYGKQMIGWLKARKQEFSDMDFFVPHPNGKPRYRERP